ncbi:COP9 signalosome complex subunit 5 [Abortiporus biennis]
MASSSGIALKTFSLANDITQISPQDEIYKFDVEANKRLLRDAPWTKEPHYFKTCKISATALIKMVIHARSGVPYEIMGMMQGKVTGNSLVIIDSFALPVQGTETRVNAANEAYEYMVQYIQGSERVSRLENAVGWYHSHPGYGCWLSGIDVSTQLTNQKFQDPFVAVVIDPNRTISADAISSEYQSIPLSKIEDFGVHANQYYQLEVQIFKSSLDDELLGLLWNKYWVNTLSQSPLISNRAYAVSQLNDLHQKLAKAQSVVPSTRAPVPMVEKDKALMKKDDKKKDEVNQLTKSVRDANKIAIEAQHGLIAQVLKDIIFSMRPAVPIPGIETEGTTVAQAGDLVDTAMSIG